MFFVNFRKRMLKLELTDGQKNVAAMEYTPIPCLTTKLSPGCKILLNGPMRCVNKIIFLEMKNVKILGGEVDDLIIPNAYENVLLRMLNKPANPNPKLDYTETVVGEPSTINNVDRVVQPPPQQQHQNVQIPQRVNEIHRDFIDDGFEDDDLLLSNLAEIAEENHRHTSPNQPNLFDDDDDDDFLLAAEAEIQPPANNSGPNDSSPGVELMNLSPPVQRNNNISDEDIEMTEMRNEIESSIYITPPQYFQSVQQSPEQTLMSQLANNSRAEQSQQHQRTSIPTIFEINYPYKIRGINLVTIDQLAEIDVNLKVHKLFIVKAEIDNLFEKLKIQNGKWHLGAFLKHSDSNDVLKVRFDDSVLCKIFDYTSDELTEMKKRIPVKPQMREEIEQVFFFY